MQTVKVSKNCYVPTENISFAVEINSETIRRDIREKKQKGLVMDLTSGRKMLSAIYLKNGTILLLNTLLDTLNKRIIEEGK